MSALRVTDAKVWFGGVRAVDGVSLTLEPGGLYGIIGPNGSGKTTLINAISRVGPLTSGSVHLGDVDVSQMGSHEVSRVGVARTFQTIRLLQKLSVRENVMLGADRARPEGSAPLRRGGLRHRAAERRRVAGEVDALLERLGLADLARAYPAELPYGTQRRVEICRALATRPTLLLLDEPVAGMARGERDEIAELIRDLPGSGLTLLVIEHDVRLMLQLCGWLYVMKLGTCVAEGPPRETASRPEVQEAYLGKDHGFT